MQLKQGVLGITRMEDPDAAALLGGVLNGSSMGRHLRWANSRAWIRWHQSLSGCKSCTRARREKVVRLKP